MNKNKILGILGVAAAVALGILASTTVVAQNTLRDKIAEYGTNYNQDFSNYATLNHREGLIVATINVADPRYTNLTADVKFGPVIPDNALIVNGFIDVVTAMDPAPTNGVITLFSAGDIIADVDFTDTAGVYQCVPDYATVGDYLRVTNGTTRLTYDITGAGAVPTVGVFNVYLNYFQTYE